MTDLSATQAMLAAYIAEMQKILNDPSIDAADHALDHSTYIEQGAEDSIEFDIMMIPDVPALTVTNEEHHVDLERNVLSSSFSLETNVGAARINFTTFARASISFMGNDGWSQPNLTEDQQEVLDRYATAASFWLTGSANEALTYVDDDPDNFDNPDDRKWLEYEVQQVNTRRTLGRAARHCVELAHQQLVEDEPNAAYLAAAQSIRRAAALMARANIQSARSHHYHQRNQDRSSQ